MKELFTYIQENQPDVKKPLKIKLINNMHIIEDDLFVDGDLILDHIEITSLPDNLYIRGRLSLIKTENIFSLPDNIEIGTSLDLLRSSITKLPDNLHIPRYLDLCKSSIKTLRKGLTVGLWLDISNTEIKSLPKDLDVDKLIIVDQKIKRKLRAQNPNIYNKIISEDE